MKFNHPKFKYGNNPSAVYRMSFNTGHFYIGSSGKVKTRIVSWKCVLKQGSFSNRVMLDILPEVSVVLFEIIEFVSEESRLHREKFHLDKVAFDDNCLNRSLNPIDNSDMKPLPKHLVKTKKISTYVPKPYIRKENPIDQRKKVYQFSLDGKFIQEHKSIRAAALFAGVDHRTMEKHFKIRFIHKTRVNGVRGHIYRLINAFPEYPPIKIKEKKQFLQYSRKSIIDLNTGVFYINAKELSELYGYNEKYLYKILSGERPNRTQYRYA